MSTKGSFSRVCLCIEIIIIIILLSDLQKISNFEVRWMDCQPDVVPPIPFDKVPFIILGKKKWDCHHGKQRNKKLIEKNRQKRSSKVKEYFNL